MGFNSSSAGPFHQMLYRTKSAVSSAQARIEKEQVKQRQQLQKHRGSHEFEVGDHVLLDSRELSLPLQKHDKALADTYVGPFAITEKVNANAYRLDLPAKRKIHFAGNRHRCSRRTHCYHRSRSWRRLPARLCPRLSAETWASF
jgi:hypothetical protein